MPLIIFALLIAGVAAFFVYRIWTKRRLHKQLLQMQLSDHQRAIVARQVPMTRRLPPELRKKHEGKIQAFLDQVQFLGCDGFDVTEEVELSIAAQACLLIINSDAWYKHLQTILVYPNAFKSREASFDGYVVTEREAVRLGESWMYGPVVLSWAHSVRGAQDQDDGHNVVLHEFAHQLDALSGQTDGAPILSRDQNYADWDQAFDTAYVRHVSGVRGGHNSVLDAYGATGPEEFFAVAIEVFFERPDALRLQEPDIYRHLADLLALDPSDWR